jgi:hypothetical protein
MTTTMLNPAAKHILEVESREKAESAAKQEAARRQEAINAARNRIEAAERRKIGPVFEDEKAEFLFTSMSRQVADLADDFARQLHTAVQSGRSAKLDIASPGALAYFMGDQIAERLPALAASVASRQYGQGRIASQEERAVIIAQADKEIAEARAALAALGIVE